MKTQRTLLIALALMTVGTAAARQRDGHGQGKSAGGAATAKAAGCQPAVGKDEVDLNNVRALVETGGSMWQNRETSKPAYEIPKTEDRTGPNSMYSGALWMGGLSPDNQLKLAAVQYRTEGNDFWPGPLTSYFTSGDASVTTATCLAYDRTWKTSLEDVERHKQYYDCLADPNCDMAETFPDGYVTPAVFYEWPAMGDVGQGQDLYLAPFNDYNHDGIYDPDDGDSPGYDLDGNNDCRNRFRENPVPLYGDQNIWWVFNDKGNTHTETTGQPIGMEIHAQAFAFSKNDEVNNMTFYNYVLLNQGTQTLTRTYFGQYADPDLGCSDDDFVGCDVQRGLGYVYNWDENDESCQNGIPGYGSPPPAIGIDFFEGPFQDLDTINGVVTPFDNPGPAQTLGCDQYVAQKGIPYGGLGVGYGDGVNDNERFGMRAFIYFSRSGNNNVNDPDVAIHYYNYLRSIWKDGTVQTYGGTGYSSSPTAVRAYYMFPGNTDPLGWGTGCAPQPAWEETAQVNPDRRFVESAGPFTLEPGAYNNITVGVVWARGSNRLESVAALKVADDKAQALFDNCFRVLNGPDAPDVAIQELDRELILYISNPAQASNNYYDYSVLYPELLGHTVQDENYIEKDPTIPEYRVVGGDTILNDRYYRFEGYKIYQVAEATVGPDEVNDVSRARLVAQCDIHDTVSQIVNWIQNSTINLAVPTEMVNGADSGVVHSFRITQDLFATGDPRLVNFKTYYFMAIAYGYNSWQAYSPASGQATAAGQPFPYLAGRKAASGSIHSYSGIPHKPAPENGGTVATTSFGDEFQVTRLEGQGNGGLSLVLDRTTENAIMSGPPWRADELHYQAARGPVKVKVVDPLKVPNSQFELWFKDSIAPFPTPTAFSSYKNINNGYWFLVRLDNDPAQNDTVFSNSTLGLAYEQLILDWGISVQISQTAYSGQLGVFTKPVSSSYILEGINSLSDLWYSGIPDVDGETPLNWIRSGESNDNTSYPDVTNLDNEQEYEKVLNGTWTAGPLIGDTSYQPGAATAQDPIRGQGLSLAQISESPSVMVVFTPNKDKWTRCVVLEEHDKPAETTPVGTKKLYPRQVPSVDKMGRKTGDTGYNADEGNLTSGTGMGWFPGYAIDLETGERLNMAFGENSSLFGGTIGKDMIWNPTDQLFSDLGQPIFGGSHWIYVFKNLRKQKNNDQWMPQYDEGAFIRANLTTSSTTSEMQRVYRALAYVGSGLLAPGRSLLPIDQGLIPSEVRLVIDVAKPYTVYQQPYSGYLPAINPTRNSGYPLYTFNTQGQATQTNVASVAESSLDLMGIVPNPYYAFSGYETTRLDNRVKFINLPEKCTISIFTVSGTLIRKFNKANSLTYLDWDLRNSYNVPIAGGTYICHIDVPGVGERVIKWFGVIRPIDLTNF